jgi:hypothetical protein
MQEPAPSQALSLSDRQSTCSMPSGNVIHACLRASYTETLGGGKPGSANAPTGTATNPGSASIS